MEKIIQVVARVLLAHIFVLAGLNKIGGYADTQAYMDAMGVPGILLPLVIILELAGGLALIVGWQTRWAAYALAVFTAVAAVIFHSDFGQQVQMILFMKNWAMVGGLLLLGVYGAGAYSLDARKTAA
jgi:putative oxidoreductase